MTDCCNLFCFFILTKHFCKSSNTCGSSAHFANIWHTDNTEVVNVLFEKKTPFKWLLLFTLFETPKKLWLAWVISHLCHEHNLSGFRVFVSSTTFGHKSCIYSTIDSCRLFLHRVSSHHYLFYSKVFIVQKERTGRRSQNKVVRFSWHCNRQATLLANDKS